ncbi:cytochrome P450 [Schizophyllum commune]
MTPILILQDIAVCILLYVLYLQLKRASSHPPLPPGPPAEWLLGHLRVVPQKDAARAYHRWSKEYGSSVIHVNVLGQPIVVLNTLTAAVDLLHKRGAIYSDRPHWESFRMLGYEHDVLLTSSKDPSFPILRGALQNYLAKSAIPKFSPVQVREARKLVKRILEAPEGWKGALQMFSTSVIVGIITGHEIKTPDDDYLQIGRGICEAMSGGGPPGATGVDLFPFLRHLPSWCDPTGSTAHVRKNKPAIMRMINVPFERVTQEIKAGTAQPSFILSAIQEAEAEYGRVDAETAARIRGVAGSMFSESADQRWQTLDTLTVFIFAIVNHPEVQERARAELNAVVGPDRLPGMEDRPNLPYVERMVQETFRIYPVAPLGAPHKSTEDDVYDGMFIPKGSVVVSNAFAMTHDQDVYTDPWRFDPDRYLPLNEGGRGEPFPAAHFGFGRRRVICPGRYLGEASVFIATATILHVLTIKKMKDENGEEITIDPETATYTTGLESHPEKVWCTIEAISERAKRLALEVE